MNNYSVSIRSVLPGTDGSVVGHAWITLSDGVNPSISYGYYPAPGFNYVFGDPGRVEIAKDDDAHKHPDFKTDIPITAEQYNKIKDFVENIRNNPPGYDVTGVSGGNCASFVQGATNAAGITNIPNLYKSPFPWWLPKERALDEAFNNYYRRAEFNTESRHRAISSSIGTTPDPLVKTIRYVDPLILDLDGDGLEITPLSKGILFDADGDTIKTGTAWAGADDGMLVWDRNGNGTIDSGAELFGDETVLGNGKKASDGFAALSDLDRGSVVGGTTVGAGDGVFDVKDAQYTSLCIWRDLNQDGISQANELKTLSATGVTSIKLASTASSTNYGDAILAQAGTFKRTDGSTGQAGSFILAQDNFKRQFTPITVSDAAKALPGISGSGWVRDLQEAATLSPELIGLVNQAKNATTRAGYKDAVAGLLREWGNDSGYNSASKQALNSGYGLILSNPADAQEAGWMDKAIKASEADRNTYRATLSATDLVKFDAMRERMVGGLEKIYAYEAFTGHTFLNSWQIIGDALNYVPRVSSAGRVAVEVTVPFSQILNENRNGVMSSQAGYIQVTIPNPPSGTPHVTTLWNRLVDDATANLMPTLRLSKYLDMVDLSFGADGVSFDFGRLNASLAAASAASVREGATLVIDLNRSYGAMLGEAGWNGDEQVRNVMLRAASESTVFGALVDTGFKTFSGATSSGSDANDAYSGDASANTFNGGTGSDLVNGLGGNDNLSGDAGNDVVLGGDGDDTLSGGAGDDLLLGGAGNDYLTGGAGSDIYRLGLGSGVDTLYDYDSATGSVDTVEFADVKSTDLTAIERRGSSDDLVMTYGNGDQLTVQGYLGYGPSYVVEQVKFSDGVSWDYQAVKSRVITKGTAAADSITGYDDSTNRIYGYDGNDTLKGGAMADLIDGGTGNDTLSGGGGNDILTGGTGNDYLSGNAGSDIYRLGLGSGVDTLYDYDPATGSVDTVEFADVKSTDLTAIERRGSSDDLVMTYGNGDQLTVQGYLGYGPSYVVEQIKFSDGVNWDYQAVKSRVITKGTTGNDSITGYNDSTNRIYGYDGNDVLKGGALADLIDGGIGNDSLTGGGGNDILTGGTGNDYLSGDAGSDIYRLGLGSGVDTLYDYDSATGSVDTVEFADVKSTDLTAIERRGSSDDLVMTYGNGNQLTVQGYLGYGPSYVVEQIKFSDGVSWDYQAVKSRVITKGTAAADSITGYDDSTNRIYGYDGNDTLKGGSMADLIDGGIGNDTLTGGGGNDILTGGTGNDYLSGNAGSDIYRLGLGSGVDTIYDYDSATGSVDTVEFSDVKSTDLTAIERRGSSDDLVMTYGNGDQITIQGYLGYGPSYVVEQIKFSDGANWDYQMVKSRVITNGTAAADSITGYDDSTNRIYGYDGNDTLKGGSMADLIDGGIGNDTLTGGGGNDILTGGTGNDYLSGNAGSDIYRLGLGSGVDTIYDYDSATGSVDTVEFSDVKSTDLTAIERRGSSDDLVMTYGNGDQITIQGYLGYGPSYVVEQIKFSDGANWDYQMVKSRVITKGTSAADSISGYDDSTNRIYGYDGNDTLKGGAMADLIDGGTGNDTLSGGGGNDILTGGTGNDYLSGNAGSDIYRLGLGSGVDTIYDYDSATGSVDTVEFSDVKSTDLTAIERRGSSDDLVMTYGNGDQLTVQGYLGYGPIYVVEQIKLSDGVSWDYQAVKSRVITKGTAAADSITGYSDSTNRMYGYDGNDTLNGGALADLIDGGVGADTMVGGLGDDIYVVDAAGDVVTEAAGAGTDLVQSSLSWTLGTNVENLTLTGTTAIDGVGNASANAIAGNSGSNRLDGGAGADTLSGGAGSDIYVLGRGHGADLIQENDSAAGNTDVLQLMSGVTRDQLWFRQLGNNLEVSIIGTADTATVQNWYLGSQYHVEQFKTSDGKTLLDSKVQGLVSAMASFAPPAVGQMTLPANYQTTLAPVMAANWGP